MSIETEDSLLEEALRADLPSAGTEARLRRRLLAAGVAVGQGVATTTAVASGGAAATGAGAGLVAKVVGLSWGVKLGLAAAVAIPTVGLWLDNHSARQAPSSRPAVVMPTQRDEAAEPRTAAPPAPAARAMPATPAEPEPAAQRGARVIAGSGAPPPAVSTAGGMHPSQSDFAALDAPSRAPQVASTLADETRLLDAAFAELGRGNRAQAAALIGEHEARYPSGLLQKERERAKARLSELSRGE